MEELITEIKEDHRGATVFFDGGEKLWLSRSMLREQNLQVDEAFDIDTLKAWLLPRQYPEALNRAVGLLAMRGHSEGELRQKLTAAQYMDDTVEMVIYKLQKENLLNDEAFARSWAAARARKQLGKYRIMQELLSKGIAHELAKRVVDELPIDESNEQANALAIKLLRRYQDEDARKAMQKLIAAMARRGYGFADARNAAEHALACMQQENAEDEDGDEP
ncbi:MAG: regulatory protein RecX [Clostridia bacterium]